MNQTINKQIAKSLMEFKGEIRGMDLKADAEFVLKREGKEGLKKVKDKLEEIGFPIEYGKINSMNFYPGGLKVLSLLAIKETLNYDDKRIKEMGKFAPKISFIIKLFVKHFAQISKFFFEETPKIWKKYWTVGNFLPLEVDEKKKYAIVRIKELNLHPLYCLYLEGYFSTFIRLVTGGEEISVQETKCFFRGDKYHEFLLKWQ